MGTTFSSSLSNLNDLDSRIESYLVKTLSFGGEGVKAAKKDESSGSGKTMILRASVSFNECEFGTTKSLLLSPVSQNDNIAMVRSYSQGSKQFLLESPSPDTTSSRFPNTGDERNEAAVKVQKTYKSFRTRRQLADCAVLVEQRWWKLVDIDEPKCKSISFFDIDRPETAVSRWSRAMTKAAMVGKGLSKAEKARKLALQHWLEAIDPRHRYGHNLQFYYAKWLQCDSRQAFFYWLDIGEGREVNLERCQRSKLQQQCIKYLGPKEREAYEVKVVDGKFFNKQSGKLLDTRGGGTEDTKWIFVLSVSRILYVGKKHKGTFQHSSFLAGGATLAAGRLVVENGILKAVWPHSGHYLPTEENFEEFICFLEQHNVDITLVKRAPSVDEEGPLIKKEYSFSLRSSVSEPDFRASSEENKAKYIESSEENPSSRTYSKDTENVHRARWSRRMRPNIPVLQIPKREEILKMFKNEEERLSSRSSLVVETPGDGYETAEEYLSDTEFSVSKHNLFEGETEEDYEEPVPREKIARRIVSHKGTKKSYQLADQLACRWTTGAGPRIGCVRDYPVELQFRVLEEVNLSPKSAYSSPRKSARTTPTTPQLFCREASRSPLGIESMLLNQVATP